jgi:hypothetical protein
VNVASQESDEGGTPTARASSVEDGIFVRSSITAIGTIIGGLAAFQAHEEETKCSQQPYNHIERL